MRGKRLDAAHGEERAQAEGERSRVPHFDAAGIQQDRQTLPAVFRRTGQRVPPGIRPGRDRSRPSRERVVTRPS